LNDLTPEPSVDDIDIEEELTLPPDKGQEKTIARRLALQILYETDCAEHPLNLVIATHLGRYVLQPGTKDYAIRLATGVEEDVDRLDMIIQTFAQEWPLDQIAIVDRNILRLAIYEYAMISKLPVGVVTDEAVNLAKVFGSDASLRFINGVLGNIFRNDDLLQTLLTVEMPDIDDEDYDYGDDDDFDDEEDMEADDEGLIT
jgi:N utilization substance protein B